MHVSFKSSNGKFLGIDEKSLQLKIKAGSFGYINPSFNYRSKLSKSITHNLFGEYQYSDGGYRFKDYETGTTTSKRVNSDIKAFHAEYDAAFHINDSNNIKFKGNNRFVLCGGKLAYGSQK